MKLTNAKIFKVVKKHLPLFLIFIYQKPGQLIILNMNIESNSYQNTSPKCKGCKLFFGSQAFQWLCSSCYKKQKGQSKEDMEKPKTQLIEVKTEPSKKQIQITPAQSQQKDKNKCFSCSRKLRNFGIECKCGFVFCNMHKMPEDHKCSFDHIGQGIKKLQKDLIKVANGKLNKIE